MHKQEVPEDFQGLNLTSKEIETLKKAKVVSFYNGTIKVLLGTATDDALKDILEVCKNKDGIIIKLFTKDIDRLLREGIYLPLENYNVEYSCDTIREAPLEVIDQLGIKRILVGAKENTFSRMMDVAEYRKIYNRMLRIVKDVSDKDSEQEKFRKIYTKLAVSMEYDEENAELIRQNTELSDEDIENSIKSRNLEGAIIRRSCVCMGFAEALKQALSLVGIESELCHSEFDKDEIGHTYNQVKIDGKWYNADLTMDYERIRNRMRPKYCLKSDEDFALKKSENIPFHIPINGQAHRCPESLEIYKDYRGKKGEFWKKIKRLFRRKKKPLMLEEGKSDEVASTSDSQAKEFKDKFKVDIQGQILDTSKKDIEHSKEIEERGS